MRSVLLLLVVACSSPKPPSAPPPATPPPVAPRVAPRPPSCEKPSRLCTLLEVAKHEPDLDALASTMYGAHGAEALRKLRAHEWFEVLIVDPGLVLRLDDFLAFVTAEKLTDPWSARERYAAKLGKKRVYRGMAVTDEDRKSIETTGILSGALRGGTPPRPAHILDQLVGHLAGAAAPDEDTAISVSDDPEISKCVAHMFGRGNKAVHVWTLEMSPLDLVTADVNHPLCQPEPAAGSVACKRISYRKPYPPEVYPLFCRQFYDAKVESFVLYRIDPSEYVSSKAETEFANCSAAIAAVKKAKREAGRKYCNDADP